MTPDYLVGHQCSHWGTHKIIKIICIVHFCCPTLWKYNTRSTSCWNGACMICTSFQIIHESLGIIFLLNLLCNLLYIDRLWEFIPFWYWCGDFYMPFFQRGCTFSSQDTSILLRYDFYVIFHGVCFILWIFKRWICCLCWVLLINW